MWVGLFQSVEDIHRTESMDLPQVREFLLLNHLQIETLVFFLLWLKRKHQLFPGLKHASLWAYSFLYMHISILFLTACHFSEDPWLIYHPHSLPNIYQFLTYVTMFMKRPWYSSSLALLDKSLYILQVSTQRSLLSHDALSRIFPHCMHP